MYMVEGPGFYFCSQVIDAQNETRALTWVVQQKMRGDNLLLTTLKFGDLRDSNPLYDYLLHKNFLSHDHRKDLDCGFQSMMKIC